jgi:hypothetical protein
MVLEQSECFGLLLLLYSFRQTALVAILCQPSPSSRTFQVIAAKDHHTKVKQRMQVLQSQDKDRSKIEKSERDLEKAAAIYD